MNKKTLKWSHIVCIVTKDIVTQTFQSFETCTGQNETYAALRHGMRSFCWAAFYVFTYLVYSSSSLFFRSDVDRVLRRWNVVWKFFKLSFGHRRLRCMLSQKCLLRSDWYFPARICFKKILLFSASKPIPQFARTSLSVLTLQNEGPKLSFAWNGRWKLLRNRRK